MKQRDYYDFLVKYILLILLYGYELDKLLTFVEKFISEQLNCFDNTRCSDINYMI